MSRNYGVTIPQVTYDKKNYIRSYNTNRSYKNYSHNVLDVENMLYQKKSV